MTVTIDHAIWSNGQWAVWVTVRDGPDTRAGTQVIDGPETMPAPELEAAIAALYG